MQTVSRLTDPHLQIAPQVKASQWAANRIARVRGALLAEQGRFDDARAELEAAKRSSEELGAGYVISALQGHFMGPVELLAGNPQRAVELELAAYEWMTGHGFVGFANTVAANLARAMLELDRNEEAEQWATAAREIATGDDPAARDPRWVLPPGSTPVAENSPRQSAWEERP